MRDYKGRKSLKLFIFKIHIKNLYIRALFFIKLNVLPRVQESKSPRVQESKSPRVQESKSPRVQESKSPRVQESKSPRVQESKSPRVQESKSPRVQESKSPRVQESKSPRVQESKSPRVQESKSPRVQAILLAAGYCIEANFPIWQHKPKHLYSFYGQIQLKRSINQLIGAGFSQKDISIVVGYEYQKIIDYLNEENFRIKVKINHNWDKSAAYTLQTAIQDIDSDFMVVHADEIVKPEFLRHLRIQEHKIFIHGGCFGGKFLRKHIPIFKATLEGYLINHKDKIIDTHENVYSPIESGASLAIMIRQVMYNIEDYKSITIDMDNIVPDWWICDCDYFIETDEHKNMNCCTRFMFKLRQKLCKIQIRVFNKLISLINKIRSLKILPLSC